MEENKPLVTETEYPYSDTDIISGDGTPIIDTSDQNVDTSKEESTTSKPDAGESTENSSTNTEENGEEEDTTKDPANDPATLESALLVSTYAALNKLAEYVPTKYVNNSEPDIDAEHLNNTEQGLLRVTNLLNGAVDVINDLQTTVANQASAIETLNSNLSKRNPPYAEKSSGVSYGLPDYSYVLGNAGNKKGTASGDVYYIAVDATGRLYGGTQVNNATDITWKETAEKDYLGVTQYNGVDYISLSGKLSNIGEWVKNNGTPGKCTFVRVEPSDSDGYFGTSGFSILWMRTSVNYGWCILISDNPRMVVFGRNSTGWHWYAPSLTEVS
nr:MAG TPA: hypothetical protein [Caudoviricetes sp.]